MENELDLKKVSGLPDNNPGDSIAIDSDRFMPTPDANAVMGGCGFMSFCKDNPAAVTEPMWYAALSIAGRLHGKDHMKSRELAHEISNGHPGYSPEELDLKLDQALISAGPRTCANISTLFDGCTKCPHFKKIMSPIQIRGENFIETEKSGFHKVLFDGKKIKIGPPQYDDLRKFFSRSFPSISLKSGQVFIWKENHWQETSEGELKAFAQIHFFPPAKSNMCKEFSDLMGRTNLKDVDWFSKSTNSLVNFQNGVLDLKTRELLPHTPDYGFRYILGYNYDSKADCPKFKNFMREISCGRYELESTIMEYFGYALCLKEFKYQFALLFVGAGANGKSTLIEVFRNILPKGSYSSISLARLSDEKYLAELEGKTINMSEETPANSLQDSSIFKAITGGSPVTARKIFLSPMEFINTCKFIFACNELPKNTDYSNGFYRRWLIIPFEADFSKSPKLNLAVELAEEAPGILNYALESFQNLETRKGFIDSMVLKDELMRLKNEQDPFQAWLDDVVEILDFPGDFVPFYHLYPNYVEYHGANWKNSGYLPLSSSQFSRRLKSTPGFQDRYKSERVKGNSARGYWGIKLTRGTGCSTYEPLPQLQRHSTF